MIALAAFTFILGLSCGVAGGLALAVVIRRGIRVDTPDEHAIAKFIGGRE